VAVQVSAALRGTSVYVVGDSTDANARLADALATQLGYAPLHTCRLLAALEASAADGHEGSTQNAGEAVAEAMLLEELSTVVRCCVATLGGGRGAAARGDCWRHLFGGITVFLEVRPFSRFMLGLLQLTPRSQDSAAPRGPQREAYAQAEVLVEAAALAELTGEHLAERTLPAVLQLLQADEKLVGKKSLYVRLGARGDWPNLAEPGSIPPLHGAV